jgi:hypothetical protein
MKTSLSERVMGRNMPKGDVKETCIVCIVANSLSNEDDSNDALCSLIVWIIQGP